MRRRSLVAACAIAITAVPAIALAAWTAPPDTLSAPGQDASNDYLAVDAAGAVTAVWQQQDGTSRRVQASRRVAGAWTAPVDLSPAGVDATAARPAGGAAGSTFAGYTVTTGATRTAYAVQWSGGAWGVPTVLGSGTVPVPTDDMLMAANRTGAAAATWVEAGGGLDVVRVARYTGGAWSAPTTVSDPAVSAVGPDVVVDASGVVTASWWALDGLTASVVAVRSTGAGWSDRQVVWSAPATAIGSFGTPALAVDASGTVTIAWANATTDVPRRVTLQASRFANGAWGTPEALVPATEQEDWVIPALATVSDGTTLLGWNWGTGATSVPMASIFAGGAWGAPQQLPGRSGDVASMRVAGGGGIATATWVTGVEGATTLNAARWSGGAWAAAPGISPAGQQVLDDTDLAQDDRGVATSVWLAKTGANNLVMASVLGFPATAPGTPAVVPASKRVTATWTAPTWDGGSPVTSYVATATPGGATCTAQGDATSCAIAGLSNGTPYTVTVHAVTADGPGTESAASAAVTPSTVPGRPRSVRAHPAPGGATVTWRAPRTNGGAAVNLYIVRSLHGGRRCTTTRGRSCTVRGLVPGRVYRFTVQARNVSGTGGKSVPSNRVRPGALPVVTG